MIEATISNPSKRGQIGPHTPDVTCKRRRHVNKTIANLPPEILSQVVLMGEELARSTRARTVSYNTVQEVASHVCRYWRQVAVNTPVLWTYIHISRPLPNPLASLYLGRAGSTLLLDIDIEMRSRYWKKAKICIAEWDKQRASLNELLCYLFSRGAGFRRWKSLSISSKHFDPLCTLILRLNAESAPFLERITFKKHLPEIDPDITLGFVSVREKDNIFSNRYCISQSALPNLRCVDFGLVPCNFIFNRPSPLLTGLTHLNLEIDRDDSWLFYHMHSFFAANPQLETIALSAKSRAAYRRRMITRAPDPPISFLRLRSLSISAIGPRYSYWLFLVLHMIDSPALESLALEMNSFCRGIYELCLMYLATGSIPTWISYNRSSSTESAPGVGPIYPTLRSLDISKLEVPDTTLETLLLSLSTVTRLSIGHHDNHLRVLSSPQSVLPNLVALQITDGCNTSAVARCLYRRWELGVSVKDIIPRFSIHSPQRSKNRRWLENNEIPMFKKHDDLLDLDPTDDEAHV
ncbi:unnamed protein product [Rhizoctonia solani]|uniref:F-box domain-containing protein n=1 Tax=Rhizoctonia solani TaxID=456999 RepID=A0A8H3HMK4_9AGAM|nr:unnamed protein product [Rhizoctonia solani]